MRMQWIEQPESAALQIKVVHVDLVERSNDGLVHTIGVVGPIDAEGRLHNGDVDVELDAGGDTRGEVRVGGELQLCLLVHEWEILVDIGDARGVQFQCILVKNARGAGVDKQSHTHRPDKRDTVFNVSDALHIATGEGDGVHHERDSEASG